jgi:hypothetical protein
MRCEGWIGVQQATDKKVTKSSKRLDIQGTNRSDKTQALARTHAQLHLFGKRTAMCCCCDGGSVIF